MASNTADINYTFTKAQLEQLKPYGQIQSHDQGDLLVAEGDNRIDCLITLSGQVDIHVSTPEGPTRVGWMEAGQFAGDIGVLTGQSALAEITMGKSGEVLHIPHGRFQKLLAENAEYSEIFIRTLTARRTFAHESGRGAVIVIGAAQDRTVFTTRDLLTKHNVPHSWLDPDKNEVAPRILSAREISTDQLPVVLRGSSRILVRPTVTELSEAFGLDLVPDSSCADIVVVGAGPAGLAASVYAASEGLSVVTLDSEGPGGQAGTSSLIENYLGFPQGLSGRELAERAAVQAQKFGVRIAAPAKASSLQKDGDGNYCINLEDGRRLKCKALVIATGAQYRRLPIKNLQLYEGSGIYYGATPMEAQLCGGSDVAVVGAGNSAGQGALYLSKTAKTVHVIYRRADIRDTMSEYLVRRLEEAHNVILHPSSVIDELHGHNNQRLTAVTLRNVESKEAKRYELPFAFLFVGAAPHTEWLPDLVSCDERGFLKTGADLKNIDLVRASWNLDRMPSRYETSWERVYAVGDVRTGSVKRVASAVGEGSVVVSDIHQALAENNR